MKSRTFARGEQVPADLAAWQPPTVDLRPQVIARTGGGRSVIRTHEAGTLRASDAGHTVTLAGWVASRRDHGGVAFIDLRDASGIVQVVVRDDEIAHDLRNEWCIAVTGEVRRRIEGNVNPRIATGEIEVVASSVDGAQRVRPIAVPDRRARGRRRGSETEVPVSRSAPTGTGESAATAQPGESRGSRCA